MVTLSCAKRRRNRGSSRAVKNFRQLVCVLAFALVSTSHSRERLGKRKDLARNQQILIFGADRMPVHAFSRDRDFRHEVVSRNCDACRRDATQCDATYHSIFFRDLFSIEKAAKLLGLVVSRDSRCESHAKAFRSRTLDTCACALPSAGAAVQIVQVWCRAVETDL